MTHKAMALLEGASGALLALDTDSDSHSPSIGQNGVATSTPVLFIVIVSFPALSAAVRKSYIILTWCEHTV